jgi:hypothetical protein
LDCGDRPSERGEHAFLTAAGVLLDRSAEALGLAASATLVGLRRRDGPEFQIAGTWTTRRPAPTPYPSR